MNYLGDFTSFTEKKKGNIFTRMGWIWAATACTGRDIVPSALGLAQSLSRAEGGVAASKTPARSAPWPRGDGFRRSRVHLTCGPDPQGRRRMGPTSRVHPQPPARARRETEEARPDGAGALPGGTGHLRRRPADQRVQETTPHPPRCAATAGVVGRGRFVGRGGRGRRWRWSSTAWPREVGEVAGESSTMVVVMPWNDEARRRGLGWREFKPRPTARLRPWWWMEGTGKGVNRSG